MEIAILTDEISLDLEEALQHGAALGFRKYEVRCLDEYTHRVPSFLPGRIERLEALVREEAIEITALSPGTFKIDLSEKARVKEELKEVLPRTCELAQRLGVPRVIVFGFMREAGVETAVVVDHLRTAGEVAALHGLELAIENEPGSYCDTGIHTAEIVAAIQLPKVGINWDPANAVVAGEAAYPIGYEAVRPFLQNVHIKDAIPLPPDRWENRLLGDGGMNWVGQLRALLKDAPVKHLTLETHVFPLLESTREDLRRLHLLLKLARAIDRPSSA